MVKLGSTAGSVTGGSRSSSSSSSSKSTASKLSSLEKTLAPASQAKAAAPAPKPSYYSSEERIEFQPTKATPVKTIAQAIAAPVVAPTPAQSIQASIASGVNVPITPETLAARNAGLKVLSAPAPTTGLGAKAAQVTGGALKGGVSQLVAELSAPEPVKTITYVPIKAPTYSLQETLAISEAMRQATELATPPSIKVAPVPLDEIETAPAAKVAAIANNLLATTSKLNQAISNAVTPPKSIDVSSKVQAALANSLKTGNVNTLQQATNTILNAVDKVATQAISVANKKIDTEKAALYTLSSAA
ncbi:MAG: hypothetical protein PHE11_08030, partial [Candidatus Omnitrophica bacterium]|nr:hypothetical protein [Candidatus Omnitrophota bacterium]